MIPTRRIKAKTQYNNSTSSHLPCLDLPKKKVDWAFTSSFNTQHTSTASDQHSEKKYSTTTQTQKTFAARCRMTSSLASSA